MGPCEGRPADRGARAPRAGCAPVELLVAQSAGVVVVDFVDGIFQQRPRLICAIGRGRRRRRRRRSGGAADVLRARRQGGGRARASTSSTLTRIVRVELQGVLEGLDLELQAVPAGASDQLVVRAGHGQGAREGYAMAPPHLLRFAGHGAEAQRELCPSPAPVFSGKRSAQPGPGAAPVDVPRGWSAQSTLQEVPIQRRTLQSQRVGLAGLEQRDFGLTGLVERVR